MGWHYYKNKPGRYYRGRKSNGEYYTAHDDFSSSISSSDFGQTDVGGCLTCFGFLLLNQILLECNLAICIPFLWIAAIYIIILKRKRSKKTSGYNTNSQIQLVEDEWYLAVKRLDDESVKEQIVATILDDMVKCYAGICVMGEGEKRYKRFIDDDFYMSKYPVTQIQYKVVMGDNPSYYRSPNNPVESVSLYDARAFCKKLNILTASSRPDGYVFDIPSEIQWEYACKSGTDTSFNNGKNITSEEGCCSSMGEVGWYRANSDGHTHPVGTKKPNTWGIYDMHGNVWEWCNSSIIEDNYIIKGGSWNNFPKYCCSTAYQSDKAAYKSMYLGFRVALVPEK